MDTLDKIINLLETSGVEQRKLAEAIGTRKQTISDWKKGKTKSYLKYIDKIADYFDVSTDYLLKDEYPQISAWLEQIIYKLSKELNQPRERLIEIFMDYSEKISNLAEYEERFTASEEQLRTIFKNYLKQEKTTFTEKETFQGSGFTDIQKTLLQLAKELSDEDGKNLIEYGQFLLKKSDK